MGLFLHYLSMDYLLKGVYLTLGVTALGLGGGAVLGLALASMQLSRHVWLSGFARAYAVIFRGTPLILQMVFFYDALPYIGLKFSALIAAGLALAANEAPFIAEILRSGVLGVDKGQVAAGQALGMSSFVLMRRIIAPQAIRTMIPAFGNETVSALKNSSLASFVSVQELTLRSTQLASSTFDFFSVFMASGLMYLCLTSAVSVFQVGVEFFLDLDRLPSRHPVIKWLASRLAVRKVDTGESTQPIEPASYNTRLKTPLDLVRGAHHCSRVVAVEIENLSKQYGQTIVLKGLNLTVRTGEVIALLGPSGSGKSTLLRCINRLEEWDSGSVRICGHWIGLHNDGRPLAPSDLAEQRATVGVGMVFQHFNLFSHLTALENVAGPLRWVHGMSASESDLRARELLARVDLSNRADALPRHLSGGQQQRVAIARALAPKPKILLLDEPTSALDPELVNEVLEVIRKLAFEDNLTMIISTHQLRFAKEVADRVVFLSQGVIIEEGTAEEVLTRPKNALTARFLNVMGATQTIAVSV